MVAIANETETSVGLSRLAFEALARANGDWDKAMLILRTMVIDDRMAYERLIEPLIEDGLWTAIRNAAHKQRRSMRRQMVADPPVSLPIRAEQRTVTVRPVPNPDRGAAGLIAMVERTLHDYPLPGGKRMGDATPTDILDTATYYRRAESTNRREARWFELIHEAMHGGSCVEKVLPVGMLERLRRQVEEE